MSDLEPDLNATPSRIEQQLAGWAPSAPRISRDRLLFEAGRAASDRTFPRASWQLATAASSLLAMGLALGWAHEHGRRQAMERIVADSHRSQSPRPNAIVPPSSIARRPPRSVDPSSYLAMSLHLSRIGELGEPPPSDHLAPTNHHPDPDDPILTPYRARSSRGRIDL